jgi:hypothetical protein
MQLIDFTLMNFTGTIATNSTGSCPYPREFLFAIGINIMIIAIFGMVTNSVIILIFHCIKILRKLPLQPLVQLIAVANLLECCASHTVIAFFMLTAQENKTNPISNLCKCQFLILSLTKVSLYWTYLALTVMQFCHTKGYSFYYKYKKYIVFVFCCISVIVALFVALWELLGTDAKFELNYNLFICNWNNSLLTKNAKAAEFIFIGVPVLLSLILKCWLLMATSNDYPVPREQAFAFASCNASFFIVLVVHSLFFITPWLSELFSGPPLIYPLFILINSICVLINFICFLRENPTFRFICKNMFRGQNFTAINFLLETRCKKKFIRRRGKFSQDREQYQFVEEIL